MTHGREVAHTFDALADVTRELVRTLGVTRYTVDVQDYGAPIAWRLALADPDAIEGVISQNGSAYEGGFVHRGPFARQIGLASRARDPTIVRTLDSVVGTGCPMAV